MIKKNYILIVDDDSDDREIMRDAFLSCYDKADYVPIENGEALIQYLHQRETDVLPELIMLDLNMPGKDGRQALREIRGHKHFQYIPTVIFTTSSSHLDKRAAYELGANLFVTKPDTFNKLVELTQSITRLWLP